MKWLLIWVRGFFRRKPTEVAATQVQVEPESTATSLNFADDVVLSDLLRSCGIDPGEYEYDDSIVQTIEPDGSVSKVTWSVGEDRPGGR